MKYVMQVRTGAGWESVRPTGGGPYEYDTEEEADRMLRMCYPDQTTWDRESVRVVPLEQKESA